MSPKTFSPNISMRLNTRSGLRRESPAMSRLTSPWTPRTDTRWPRRPQRAGHLGDDRLVVLGVLVFAVEIRQDGDLHGVLTPPTRQIHAPARERHRHSAVAHQLVVEPPGVEGSRLSLAGMPPAAAAARAVPPRSRAGMWARRSSGGPRPRRSAARSAGAPPYSPPPPPGVMPAGVEADVQHHPDGAPEQIDQLEQARPPSSGSSRPRPSAARSRAPSLPP